MFTQTIVQDDRPKHQSRFIYLLLILVHDLVSTVDRRARSLRKPDAVHYSGVGDADDAQRQKVLHDDKVDDVHLARVCAAEDREHRVAERLEGLRGPISSRQRKKGIVLNPDHPEGEQCRQAGHHTDCPDNGHDDRCRVACPTRLERPNDGVVTVDGNDCQGQNAHVHTHLLNERRHRTQDLWQVPRRQRNLPEGMRPEEIRAGSRAGPSAGGVPPGTGTGC